MMYLTAPLSCSKGRVEDLYYLKATLQLTLGHVAHLVPFTVPLLCCWCCLGMKRFQFKSSYSNLALSLTFINVFVRQKTMTLPSSETTSSRSRPPDS